MRYKPMLAYPVSDKPINYEDKVYMQPKLDGARCLIQYDKKTGVKAYTRTGKEWKNIHHITSSLEKWFQSNQTTVLDGELYNHDLRDDFETIISIIRRQTPDDIDMLESRDMVQFHCYDIIHPDNSLFEDRNRFIKYCVGQSSPYVHIVETTQCFTESDAKLFHQDNLEMGYEGSILRTNDEYQCKRSHSLRKFKDFQDAEATITSWVEGKGKRVGTIGKFMAVDADGNEFGMPVMDKFDYLQNNFKIMQGWVGKTATFTYFERTKAGSYRHPLFKCIRDYE
jgi:ATP-dependent DNA ligase